jgi:hypothetical protein
MARGKYLSLEEARKTGQIDQFCKEHPSESDGRFGPLLNRMLKGSPAGQRTSSADDDGGCSGTRTRQGKTEASGD